MVKRQENKAEVWGGNPFARPLWGWILGFPLPCGQLFQVHGSKFKFHPVRHLDPVSVLRIAHAVLFLCIGKHTLYFLLPRLVDVPVLRCVPDVFRHFHKVLPDVAGNSFLTLGALRTHGFCRTVLAQIRLALVLTVAVPVCCGIVQGPVFRANHIVIEFIVNVGVPGLISVFGFRVRVGRGQNTPTLKNSFADPRCFVGAVANNNLVLGIVLAMESRRYAGPARF